MSKIISSYQDLLREQQDTRCRAALKLIDVPDNVINQLEGPILWQVAHLTCVLEGENRMDWRDALRWCYDHRGELIEHAKNVEAAKRVELEKEYKDLFTDEEQSPPQEAN